MLGAATADGGTCAVSSRFTPRASPCRSTSLSLSITRHLPESSYIPGVDAWGSD